MEAARKSVEYLNPEGLHRNPAFSQVVVTRGSGKTIYVGGQDALDENGQIVGLGNIKLQAIQVLQNLLTALEAGGADLEHVVKWNVYLVQGYPLQPAYEVFQSVWGERPNPPAITMAYVPSLANPDFIMEMDAVAFVPDVE